MDPQEILSSIHAQPFRPFRIRMNSGRTFDIRYLEMVGIARDCLILFNSSATILTGSIIGKRFPCC